MCGAVEFVLQPPTDFVAHCHCRSCRLAHGSPVTTWTSVPRDRFRFVKGRDAVNWYRSSRWIEWGFCSACGSSMLYRAVEEGHHEAPRLDAMYVAVGSLIDPIDRPARTHVSFEERVDWLAYNDDLPKLLGKTDRRIDEP